MTDNNCAGKCLDIKKNIYKKKLALRSRGLNNQLNFSFNAVCMKELRIFRDARFASNAEKTNASNATNDVFPEQFVTLQT